MINSASAPLVADTATVSLSSSSKAAMRCLVLLPILWVNAVYAGWEAPKFIDNYGQWQSRGCWKDDRNDPLNMGLSDGAFVFTNGMSLEFCRDLAVQNNRKYFAVSGRDVCHWGQRIDPSASLTSDSECLERCPGGPANRQCGGKNRFTVYENLWMPDHPIAPDWLDGGWNSRGCRYDMGLTWSQGLNDGAFTFYGGMTLDFCRDRAAEKNARYFSVAAGSFCYWGNNLPSSSIVKPDGDCDMRCAPPAYQGQPCGSTSTANVYENVNWVAPPQAPSSVGKWRSLGCWSDSSSDRTLKEGGFNNYGGMTLDQCLNAAGNSHWAGVEYGGECYWSSSWVTPSTNKPDSDCNMRCPGNSGQLCGGGGRLNLYYNSEYIQPVAVASYNEWQHQGCLADDGNARLLRDGASSDYGGMTVEKCAQMAAGHQFFGVEYSGECYWGNDIHAINGGGSFNDGSCNNGCAGNMGQLCGGANRINLYRNVNYVVPPKPNQVGYQGFKYQGCYVDNPNARALGNLYEDWNAMRVQRCLIKAAGYKYAGVEYYGQCYYGNELNSQSAGDQGECNTPCKGMPGETCGGSNRINLYLNEAYVQPAVINQGPINGFGYVGCYTDDANARTFDHIVEDFAGMTVAKCVQLAAGYKYAAVEYYGQCFFGNTIANGSTVADAAGCNTACVGNKDEFCGGAGRLGLYQNQNYVDPGPGATTGAAATTATAIATTTTAASATATANPGFGSWALRGCYSDSTTARALPQAAAPDWPGNTVAKCVALAGNTRYAGVEYYGECYYGNTLSSTIGAATDCNTPCPGNTTELCGGSNRLNLYENSAFVQEAVENPGVGKFRSIGCHLDSVDARALTGGSSTDWSGNTVASCIAKAQGFKYAGVEYYGECYWGNALAASATSANPVDCNLKCGGNQTEFCGGSGRINVYEDTSFNGATTTTAAPTPSATANAEVGDWKLRGCYQDSGNARALVNGSNTDYAGMTVAKCTALAGEFRYAGVEYWGECYWGNTLSSNPADSGCNTPCAGNNAELCGGGDRLTLYENTKWVDPQITIDYILSEVNRISVLIWNLAEAVIKWRDAIANLKAGRRLGKRTTTAEVQTALEEATTQIPPALSAIVDIRAFTDVMYLRPMYHTPQMQAIITQVQQEVAAIENLQTQLQSPAAADPTTQEQVANDAAGEVGDPLLYPPPGWDGALASVPTTGWGAVVTTQRAILGIFGLVGLGILGFVIASHGSPSPTPTGDPTATETTTTTTTTSTATPTESPVLILVDCTASQFQEFIDSLPPTTKMAERIEFDFTNLRGYLTSVNKTIYDSLPSNPLVKTVMVNRELDVKHDAVFKPISNQTITINPLQRRADPPIPSTQDLYMQSPSPWHLTDLSRPPDRAYGIDTNQYWEYPGYVHDPNGGNGANIYIIDTGITQEHQDFNGRDFRWGFTRWVSDGQKGDVNDLNHHGTCMASCAVGQYSGVAKGAKIVPVKVSNFPAKDPAPLPDPVTGLYIEQGYTPEKIYKGFMFCIKHALYEGKQMKAVISISWGVGKATLGWDPVKGAGDGETGDFPDLFKIVLPEARKQNILVVAAAGNDASSGEMENETPRCYGSDPNMGLIVVGGTGRVWPPKRWVGEVRGGTNTGPQISAWAPAQDIVCAQWGTVDSYIAVDGTSASTAMTAGLIAQWLARPELESQWDPNNFARSVKAFITKTSLGKASADWTDKVPGTYDYVTCNNPPNPGVAPARMTTYVQLPYQETAAGVRFLQNPNMAIGSTLARRGDGTVVSTQDAWCR